MEEPKREEEAQSTPLPSQQQHIEKAMSPSALVSNLQEQQQHQQQQEETQVTANQEPEDNQPDIVNSNDNNNLPTPASISSAAPFSSPSLKTPFSYYNNSSNNSMAQSSKYTYHHALLTSMKTFPEKLHQILDMSHANGMTDVISFFPHGGAFKVHKPRRFVTEIMPKFFKQTKLTSFQRQLNLYGFKRISKGPDNGGYYHPMFVRGQPHLVDQIKRQVQTKTASRNRLQDAAAAATTTISTKKVTPPTAVPAPYSAMQYPHNYYSYHTTPYYPPPSYPPYGYPYMYGSTWPCAYGAPPVYTPGASYEAAPPPAAAAQAPTSANMPQVSPVVSSSPLPVSFTPIKLSAAEKLSWTPGGLCMDE